MIDPNALAAAVVKVLYNPEIMLVCTDPGSGADYEREPPGYSPSSFPMKNTFYLGSNAHCYISLANFGFPQESTNIFNTVNRLGAYSGKWNGQRYECLDGKHTILQGNPIDTHTDSLGNPLPPITTIKTSNGVLNQIRTDVWNKNPSAAGQPNLAAPPAVIVPQAINAWLLGQNSLAISLISAAFARFSQYKSTYQKGLLLFGMKALAPGGNYTIEETELENTPLSKNGLITNGFDNGTDEESQSFTLLSLDTVHQKYINSCLGAFAEK